MIANKIKNSIAYVLQQVEDNFGDKIDKLDASILLAYVLAKPRVYLNTWPEKVLNQGQIAMFEVLLNKRLNGEPIAYITGQKEFFSLMFKVNKYTLIPRPETEVLVEYILEKFKNKDNLNILDLGTGSGCIAIALAKASNNQNLNWNIIAIDKSAQALEIAKENQKLNKADNIKFLESDWFSCFENQNNKNTYFDCIVSNPPYLAQSELNNDLTYEPASALVANNNGLSDIELIITKAKDYLTPEGILIIEHGADQRDVIENLLKNLLDQVSDDLSSKTNNNYKKYKFIKDYSNLDRAVILEK